MLQLDSDTKWFVLKNMISKPLVISLETHSLDPGSPESEYINPHVNQIDDWMQENKYIQYKMLYGDTIFLREDFKKSLDTNRQCYETKET